MGGLPFFRNTIVIIFSVVAIFQPGCGIKPSTEKLDQDWRGYFFHPGDFVATIDDACQPDR